MAKSDIITEFIDTLSNNGKYVHILCFTEHNMTMSDIDLLNIPNYTLATSFTRQKRNGGSCILIHNHIRYTEIDFVKLANVCNVFECCAVELTDHKIVILCIYRVPGPQKIDIFFDNLTYILEQICYKNRHKIIICGDFNIDMLQKTKYSSLFKRLLKEFNLKIEIQQQTRPSSGTCLDNIFHNIRGCNSEILELGVSDHLAQLMQFPVKQTCALKYYYVQKRDYSKENIDRFRQCMGSLSFSDIFEENDSNKKFNAFFDLFKLFYDLCFPILRCKISTTYRPKWITRGIKVCSKKRRSLLWQYRLNPNKDTKTALSTFSARYRRVIKQTQKAQNSYYIENSYNKSKATWKVINNLKSNVPKTHINAIEVKNTYITNPQSIAQYFNDYFIDLVQSNVDCQTYDNANVLKSHKSMFMEPIVPKEMLTIINNLKNTNSTGYDDIKTSVIKSVGPIVAPVLCDTVNACIYNGVFPEALKISIIKPMHKKDEKTKMCNYRPVALIPIFAKIFEKVIYNRLNNYFEKNNIFCQEQMGFRQNKTINMAVYNFLKNIHHNMDNRKPVAAMYMDMTRAFDYVDHKILLKKLYSYGIRGNVVKLIQSYLEGRKQFTQISQVNIKTKTETTYSSSTRTILYGVPQGSVLGPLLFICYINDFPNVTNHQMCLFADDSTIVFDKGNFKEIELEINTNLVSVIEWLNANNLKINLTKTKVMDFKLRQKTPTQYQVRYKGDAVLETKTTKFLGLHIDNDMSWQSQIDSVCLKLYRFSYALYMLGKIANKTALLTAYHGYVASTLRYGLIFWGNAANISSVLLAQKRCIRSICKLKTTDTCKPHFRDLNILTVPSLYIYEVLMFVKNNMHLFSHVESQRRSDKLQTIATKTAFAHKSVYAMAPKLYNKLPCDIRNSKNNNEFKNKLFKLLNDKVYYSVKEYLDDKF